MPRRDAAALSPHSSRSDALVAMIAAFRAAGVETPERDARKLLAGVLGVAAIELISNRDARLGSDAAAVMLALRRRVAREPVSRILGQRDFYGATFHIAPATLDPRPDSECVVTTAIAVLRAHAALAAPRILDIGTGSGCLLLSILAACPAATGLGTDIDGAALAIAAGNAVRLGLDARVAWAVGAGVAPVTAPFDIVVSNPPYIRSDVIARLDPEVRLHDPLGALDGGADGLAVYRQILAGIVTVVPDGWIIFEVGDDQADAVLALIKSSVGKARIAETRIVLDAAGVRRCVAARTQSSI